MLYKLKFLFREGVGTRTILLIAILFGNLAFASKNTKLSEAISPLSTSKSLVINNLDSLIFDLANATITATYIDVPIYIVSDDINISSFDYSIQFNLAKLTYSVTIDTYPQDPTIQSQANFHPVLLKLKYTSSTNAAYVANTYLTKIRFAINPCTPIYTSDFYNIVAWLKGIVVPARFTTLDFSQFIPTANFNTGPTCTNATTQFSNTSTVQNGSVTTWAWDFGNGTSSQQNPTNSYTTSGAATTTLIVTTAIGCKDTIIQALNINVPPVSSFSYSFDCVKDSVFFTNNSSIPTGSVTGASWNFGDQGGTSNTINPIYHYNTSGFFTVALVAISNFSCSATSTLVIDLSNKVVANFTNTSINSCQGSVISFTDGSTYALSAINSWNWNFGDGNTSSQQNTSHTYTSSGNFSVTLTSNAQDGCKGTITKILNIAPLPLVQFAVGSPTGCANTALTFTDLSTTAANSTYLWNFGDGNTSNAQNPVFTYSTGGIYSVRLIITSPAGCIDSLTKNNFLTIHNSPVGNFSVSSACIQTNIVFINNLTIATGSIISWAWDFGDGNTSNVQTPANSYSVAGNYSVTLTGTSDLGCTGTASQVIVLSQRPVVNFSSISGLDCSGETLSFTNLSVPLNGPSYIWRFGDGTSSVLQSPVHTYFNSGFYAIKLIVINPGGCADSLTKPYTSSVPPPVEALFSETVLANAAVAFTNQSVNAIKVKWDFGDNQHSSLDNPLHTFPYIETYKVCLIAYNSLNCTDSTCKEIYTGVSRIVAIPSSFTPNDDNTNDVLRVRGGPFSEFWFQIFNEWGNLIFSSDTQELGWDGTFKGELQQVGVYEYVLKGKTLEDKKITLYGVVNLTR